MPRKGRGLHHRSRREHAVTDDSERLAMDDFTAAFATALALIVGLDGDLLAIVSLSLMVSLAAVGLAALCGLPLGAAGAVLRVRGGGLGRGPIHPLMGVA